VEAKQAGSWSSLLLLPDGAGGHLQTGRRASLLQLGLILWLI